MPHIHEKIDFCAETFIVFENKVLLRVHDKHKIWFSVGGHIELDEDPNTAAIREVKEEVGLDIELYKEEGAQPHFKDGQKSLIPPQFMAIHPVTETHSHVVLIYFARSHTDKLELSTTEVAEDCRWFTKDELLDSKYGISEKIVFYALKALKELSE